MTSISFFFTGRWMFSQVLCQIYGLLSQILITGCAWMIALAAFER